MLHNVHIFLLKKPADYLERFMKVHGIFNNKGEKNVKSMKCIKRHKLSSAYQAIPEENFINFTGNRTLRQFIIGILLTPFEGEKRRR
ncbi:hypothetical protein C2I18_10335 [Paenibacillus sp. PK3_47]|nr:hypothetical protein C2I18_10335 [Paenibacillus sp. PK3_47]